MSEATAAVDESYAKKKTEFFFNAINSEKIMKVVSKMVVTLILLNICLLNFSFTKFSCEETSVWFLILSGLVDYDEPKDMNKVIDTSTRVFMAIVWTWRSGKTEVVLIFLMGHTFYPKFGTVLYLPEEMQPVFSEKMSSRDREVIVKIMIFNGLESVKIFENNLLVFNLNTSVRTRNLLH